MGNIFGLIIIWGVVLGLTPGCTVANPQKQPRRWTMPESIILEVPGEGAFFSPTDNCPAITVVRNINDRLVVPHEAGHAVWDATGQPQQYK